MCAWNPEAQFIVTFDSNQVVCQLPDGSAAALGWDELQAVLIETNDSGPFGTDVWWILIGQARHLSIPQGAQGEQALLARLQQLPGFDNQMVIEAMMSTDNQHFLCWQKA